MSEERNAQEPARIEKQSNLPLMEAMQRAYQQAQSLDVGQQGSSHSDASRSDTVRRQK